MSARKTRFESPCRLTLCTYTVAMKAYPGTAIAFSSFMASGLRGLFANGSPTPTVRCRGANFTISSYGHLLTSYVQYNIHLQLRVTESSRTNLSDSHREWSLFFPISLDGGICDSFLYPVPFFTIALPTC